MSVFAAGLQEPDDKFICEHLEADSLEGAIVPGFRHFGKAFKDYAIAGVLQLDHFAAFKTNARSIAVHAMLVGHAMSFEPDEANSKLTALILEHSREWKCFLDRQGASSFLRQWTVNA